MSYESRFFSRVLWLLWIALFAWGLHLMLQSLGRGLAAHTWPDEVATIRETRLVPHGDPGDTPTFEAYARYTYGVDGATYTNDVLRFTASYGSEQKARETLQFLWPGRKVGLRYDPRDPRVATLLPGVEPISLVFLAMNVAVVAIGILGFVNGWRWRRGRPRRR